jgi:hypothetical protein
MTPDDIKEDVTTYEPWIMKNVISVSCHYFVHLPCWYLQLQEDNRKFWEELMCLLYLHKFTVNSFVAMFSMERKQSKPTAEQGSPNKF